MLTFSPLRSLIDYFTPYRYMLLLRYAIDSAPCYFRYVTPYMPLIDAMLRYASHAAERFLPSPRHARFCLSSHASRRQAAPLLRYAMLPALLL